MPNGVVLPSSESLGPVYPLPPATVRRAAVFAAANVETEHLSDVLDMLGITPDSLARGTNHYTEGGAA